MRELFFAVFLLLLSISYSIQLSGYVHDLRRTRRVPNTNTAILLNRKGENNFSDKAEIITIASAENRLEHFKGKGLLEKTAFVKRLN